VHQPAAHIVQWSSTAREGGAMRTVEESTDDSGSRRGSFRLSPVHTQHDLLNELAPADSVAIIKQARWPSVT
jgi:hypothetical protein